MRCALCGAGRAALRCGRCRQARYCGRSCQRLHWREHRGPCNALGSAPSPERCSPPEPPASAAPLAELAAARVRSTVEQYAELGDLPASVLELLAGLAEERLRREPDPAERWRVWLELDWPLRAQLKRSLGAGELCGEVLRLSFDPKQELGPGMARLESEVQRALAEATGATFFTRRRAADPLLRPMVVAHMARAWSSPSTETY